MTIYGPAERNLKHKTDVLSWGDVPWEECDLNFRPPAAARLSLSLGEAYGHLLIASGITSVVGLAISLCVAPLIVQWSTWIEAIIVAAIVGLLAGINRYRPLPRVVGTPDRSVLVLLVAGSVLAFFAAIQLGQVSRLFDLGVMLLFAVAVPSCLLAADQVTCHSLFWFTASPNVSRNTMVAWRNAWCGRFMTEHVDELKSYGVIETVVAALKNYWIGHAAVVAIYSLATLTSLLLAYLGGKWAFGIAFLTSSTALLVGASAWIDQHSVDGRGRMARVMGHWFLYSKDTTQPPWTFQSPGGSQLKRAFLSYGGVSFLTMAYALLGLVAEGSQMPVHSSSGFLVYVGFIGVAAALLAPLHWLLICVVVSDPTLRNVTAGIHHKSEGETK